MGAIGPVTRAALAFAFSLLALEVLAADVPWRDLDAQAFSAFENQRYGEAERLWLKALKQLENLGAPDDRVPKTHRKLAALFEAQGDYARSVPHYEAALSWYEECDQCEDEWSETALALAWSYEQRGEASKAEALLRANRDRASSPRGRAVSNARLGRFLARQGRLEEAENVLLGALEILESDDALRSERARVLFDLALLAAKMGNDQRAEDLWRRQVAMLEGSGEPVPAILVAGLQQYAEFLRSRGRFEEAAQIEKRANLAKEQSQASDARFPLRLQD